MTALSARMCALRDIMDIADRFDGINHWEECDARPEEDDNDAADLTKCSCTAGAMIRIAKLARAALL